MVKNRRNKTTNLNNHSPSANKVLYLCECNHSVCVASLLYKYSNFNYLTCAHGIRGIFLHNLISKHPRWNSLPCFQFFWDNKIIIFFFLTNKQVGEQGTTTATRCSLIRYLGTRLWTCVHHMTVSWPMWNRPIIYSGSGICLQENTSGLVMTTDFHNFWYFQSFTIAHGTT